jgi:adenylosuccinate lyase
MEQSWSLIIISLIAVVFVFLFAVYLLDHSEVIAEAIQTILRRENYPIPYEALKELTRGKKVTMEDFSIFIDNLKILPKIKSELKKITPLSYIGLASKIVKK